MSSRKRLRSSSSAGLSSSSSAAAAAAAASSSSSSASLVPLIPDVPANRNREFRLTPEVRKFEKFTQKEVDGIVSECVRYFLHCHSIRRPVKKADVSKRVGRGRLPQGGVDKIIEAAATYLNNVFGIIIKQSEIEEDSLVAPPSNANSGANFTSFLSQSQNSAAASSSAAAAAAPSAKAEATRAYFLVSRYQEYLNAPEADEAFRALFVPDSPGIAQTRALNESSFLFLILSLLVNEEAISETLLFQSIERITGLSMDSGYLQTLGDSTEKLSDYITSTLVKQNYITRTRGNDTRKMSDAVKSLVEMDKEKGVVEYYYELGSRAKAEYGEECIYRWLCNKIMNREPDEIKLRTLRERDARQKEIWDKNPPAQQQRNGDGVIRPQAPGSGSGRRG